MSVPARLVRAAARIGWYPPFRVRNGPAAGLRLDLQNASSDDYLEGSNELAVQRALVDLLEPGGVFYDVGSNVGFFALLAARLIGPEGQAYAFEPVPETANCIRRHAERNGFGNVTVVTAAVGNESGTTPLALSRHPGGATISQKDRPADHVGTIDVPVVTLDALVLGGDTRPPDLVKVDVEGAELAVLQGMRSVARRFRPIVICELDAATPRALGVKQRPIRRWLERHDYAVAELPDSYAHIGWCVQHIVGRPRSPSAARS